MASAKLPIPGRGDSAQRRGSRTARQVVASKPPFRESRGVISGDLPPRLVVVCVWWGDKYGREYVERLRSMVSRHLSVRHDFMCITDRSDLPEGVLPLRPPVAFGSWWQKLGLFHPQMFGPSQRVLYLDLDIVIKNSIDHIVRAEDPFCMLRNFGPNVRYCAQNSSVMLWTPTPQTAEICTLVDADVVKALHGDQDWIWRVMGDKIRDFDPQWIQSHRYDTIAEDSSIVVFHGEPKQDAVSDKWVVDNWV